VWAVPAGLCPHQCGWSDGACAAMKPRLRDELSWYCRGIWFSWWELRGTSEQTQEVGKRWGVGAARQSRAFNQHALHWMFGSAWSCWLLVSL